MRESAIFDELVVKAIKQLRSEWYYQRAEHFILTLTRYNNRQCQANTAS